MRRAGFPAACVVAAAAVGSLSLAGCSRRPTGEGADAPAQPAAASAPKSAGAPVATIGARRISAAEADATVAPALADLDYQRYLLRRDATVALLVGELTAPGAQTRPARIHLVPPLPPAVDLSGEPAAVRPDGPAPVTVTVFCNFESPHCASLQPVLADLRALHPGTVRIAARDLPLPMHAHAALAAEAARCAGRQGGYWTFHDLRWARGRTPDRAELEELARATGLDLDEFRACLAQRTETRGVVADLALARRLGLGMVPAVYVNGRPAAAPVTPDQLEWLVAEALGPAAGRAGDGQDALPTRLPLALYATIVGERPGLGLALIGGRGPEAPAALRREGERVTPAAILRRVAADRVELLVEGKVEVLVLEQPADGRSDAGRATGPDVSGATTDPEAAAREAARAALPRAGAYPVYLDREMVRDLMADRVALSAALEPVAMTVDGYRLLRLDKVAPGSLYELLGLEQGDVIVMVNERPIHEGDNPLWDALDREGEVRVRVMRPGGLARHYTYRFE